MQNREIASFTIHPDQLKKLKQLADRMHTSRSSIIERLIAEAIPPDQAETLVDNLESELGKVLKSSSEVLE